MKPRKLEKNKDPVIKKHVLPVKYYPIMHCIAFVGVWYIPKLFNYTIHSHEIFTDKFQIVYSNHIYYFMLKNVFFRNSIFTL